MYVINFNESLMQANYVYYLGANVKGKGGPIRPNRNYFHKDPYSISKLTQDDYVRSHTRYIPSHLVPEEEHGSTPYYIPNAVPMLPAFDQSSWFKSESYLHEAFYGHLIYKGCEYSFRNYFVSHTKKYIYVPLGCYYIVFQSKRMPALNEEYQGVVLDYAYFPNERNSFRRQILPYWIKCKN
jgi:DNA/RNA endonuclease G (NUC1)